MLTADCYEREYFIFLTLKTCNTSILNIYILKKSNTFLKELNCKKKAAFNRQIRYSFLWL